MDRESIDHIAKHLQEEGILAGYEGDSMSAIELLAASRALYYLNDDGRGMSDVLEELYRQELHETQLRHALNKGFIEATTGLGILQRLDKHKGYKP